MALATAARARAEEGAGLVELMVAARVAETALVVTEMAEAGAAEMDLGRVVTRVEATSVVVAAVARAEASEVGAALEASMVGLAVEARAVEARAAVAVTVAVAVGVVVGAAEVKEAAA